MRPFLRRWSTARIFSHSSKSPPFIKHSGTLSGKIGVTTRPENWATGVLPLITNPASTDTSPSFPFCDILLASSAFVNPVALSTKSAAKPSVLLVLAALLSQRDLVFKIRRKAADRQKHSILHNSLAKMPTSRYNKQTRVFGGRDGKKEEKYRR